MESKLLRWFAGGQVGSSSKAMACAAADLPTRYKNDRCEHPYDPGDLNRCLLLLEAVPEVREHFPKIAALSPAWARLIERWDELEATFLEEVGLNWSKGTKGPKTYALMEEIIRG